MHHELEHRSVIKKHFQPEEVLSLFLSICNGVQAFHECDPPLAHRDLKTSNILLDVDNTPVIMDLGMGNNLGGKSKFQVFFKCSRFGHSCSSPN